MPGYTITESVGNDVERVNRFEDLERHHPSSGRESGRDYEVVHGEEEEVRYNAGRTFIKKDFILSQDVPGPVNVPAPATGYIHYLHDATNAVRIYDKPFGTPGAVMLAQSLHMTPGTSPPEGSRIEYGQPMGRMGDTGSPGAVHAHVEAPYEQFKRYIDDIAAGRIQPNGQVNIDPLSDGVLVREERGEAVKRLQEALNKAGIRDAEGNPLPTTGYFGERTEAAVRRYQEQQGLEVDGKAGRDTLGALGLRAADPVRDGQTRPAPTEQQPTGQTPPAEQRPQPQPQPQPQANPYGFGAENPLGNVIARGEGGYNSYNRGVAGDARGAQIDFSQMTVAEVMRRQSLPGSDPDRLFAVGKYQFTPDTLSEAIRSTGVDPNARFTPQLQEKLFADYLIDEKRPSVRAYITGQTSGPAALESAQHALALEFASVGDPRKGGRGYYDGDSAGNMASTSPQQIATALEQMRTQYAANIAAGMAPEAAYRALSGDPTRFPQTTQGDPARAQDPMADGVLRHGERGESVRRLQEALNQAGIRDAGGQPLPTTGYFGDMTEQAVRRFQERQGLEVDGKAGRQTLSALGLPTQMQQETTTPAQQTPTQQTPSTETRTESTQPRSDQAPSQTTPESTRPNAQPPGQPDKLPQPDLSDKPLISNPNHPDHRLYEQAMSNLRQLGPNAGFKSQDEMERAAAAVAADAKASGLSEITHISKSQAPNGQSYLIAVQGDPTNPASKNAYLEYGQAVNQTVDQSSRMADANRVAQEQQQQQRQQVATQERPDDQGRMSMGAR